MKEKKFDLFGTVYTIKEQDVIKDNDNTELYGMCKGSSKEIFIARTLNGVTIKEEEKRIALLHEIMHAIYGTGCYSHCNDDEPLVEWTARCLNALIKQKII